MIAGVERLGYRINGAACVGAPNANGISNDFVNNEVHSAMSGVNVWPQDRGFTYDRGLFNQNHSSEMIEKISLL